MESTTNARNLLMYTGSQFGEIEQLDDIAGTCGIQVFDGSSIKPTEKVSFLESNSHKSDTKTEKIETYFLSLNLENKEKEKNSFIYKNSILPNESYFLNEPNKYLTIGNVLQKQIWTDKSWSHSYKVESMLECNQVLGILVDTCVTVDGNLGYLVGDNPGAQMYDGGKTLSVSHTHTIDTTKAYSDTINMKLTGGLNYGLSEAGIGSKICKNALNLMTVNSLSGNDPIMMKEFKSNRLLSLLKEDSFTDTGILTIGNNNFSQIEASFPISIISDKSILETTGTSALQFYVDKDKRATEELYNATFKLYPTATVHKNYQHSHTYKVGLSLDEKTKNINFNFNKGTSSNKINTKLLKNNISFIPIGSIYFGQKLSDGDKEIFQAGSVEPCNETSSGEFIEPTQNVLLNLTYKVSSFNSEETLTETNPSDLPMSTVKAGWLTGNWRNHGTDTETETYKRSHTHKITGNDKLINESLENYFENYNTTAYEKLFWD